MKALTKIIFFVSLLLIIVAIIPGYASEKDNAQVSLTESQPEYSDASDTSDTSFDINVSINVSVKLDDSVIDVNPNIIKAARTAVFNFHCDRAKLVHYNGYKADEQMNIFEVEETGKDTWEVKYRGKDTTADGYHSVTVNKEKSGSYVGSMFYSSPAIRTGETF